MVTVARAVPRPGAMYHASEVQAPPLQVGTANRTVPQTRPDTAAGTGTKIKAPVAVH